jgi:hypothetical protein
MAGWGMVEYAHTTSWTGYDETRLGENDILS